MTLKEKIATIALATTTAAGGIFAGNQTKSSQINFNALPICQGNLSLTGPGIKQEVTTKQIIFGDLPNNLPCYVGPLKAIFPRGSKNKGLDVNTIIENSVYVVVE